MSKTWRKGLVMPILYGYNLIIEQLNIANLCDKKMHEKNTFGVSVYHLVIMCPFGLSSPPGSYHEKNIAEWSGGPSAAHAQSHTHPY